MTDEVTGHIAPPAAEREEPAVAPADAAEQRVVSITHSQVTGLRAREATIAHSTVDSLSAERADVSHSMVRHVDAKLAQLSETRAVRVEGGRVVVERGGVLGLIAEQGRFVRSRVGVSISKQAEMKDTSVAVHIGGLRGDVRPVVSTPAAIGFGAGLGLVLLGVGRLLRRR